MVSAIIFLAACTTKGKRRWGMLDSMPTEEYIKKNQPMDMPPHFIEGDYPKVSVPDQKKK